MLQNREEWEDLSDRLIDEEDGCTPVQTRFVIKLKLGKLAISLPYIHFKGREGPMNPLESLEIRGGDTLIYGGYDIAALSRHRQHGLFTGGEYKVEQVHRAPR